MGKIEENQVTVRVDVSNIDEFINKTERLNELLKESRTLINELASMEPLLKFDI